MIQSFKSKETEKIWNGIKSKKLPFDIQNIARRKLRMINNSLDITDLKIPPSNRLEKLQGDRKGLYSVQVNNQWRIVFAFRNGHAYNVEIVDYH